MSIERGEQWTCDHCGMTAFVRDENIEKGVDVSDRRLLGFECVELEDGSCEKLTLCRSCYDGYLAVAYYLHNMESLFKSAEPAGISTDEMLRRATRIAKIQKERFE